MGLKVVGGAVGDDGVGAGVGGCGSGSGGRISCAEVDNR